MVTVYEIWPDYEVQGLEPADGPAFSERIRTDWKFDGTPIGRLWKPPEVYVRLPLLPEPDIWRFYTGFAFSEKACDHLQLFLDQSGEQLPLFHEGRKLTVLNVTYCLNCLDKKNSIYDEELPHMIDKYVFHRERLDYSLFKIPEMRLGHWFTVEGLAPRDEEFKGVVELNGFRGMHFREVWSDGK